MEEGGCTLWCGNLAEQVTEELLYELFLQAGPLEKVRIGRDRDGKQRNFAFITYCHEVSIPYAIQLLRGTSLFNKALILTYRGRMPYLPPPIRCQGPEIIHLQSTDMEQFVNMAQNLNDDIMKPLLAPRLNKETEPLMMASLQGNWSHRHHPYHGKHGKNDNRPRHDHFRSSQRDTPPPKKSNWNSRRSNRRGYRD